MEKILVEDNFLSPEDFENIQKLFAPSPSKEGETALPWYFFDSVVDHNDNGPDSYFFCHQFYTNYRIVSDWYFDLMPLISKIGAMSIVRIQANCLTKTNNRIIFPMHNDIDVSKFKNYLNNKCTTGIYYVNTNNGATLFEDGTEVQSVANRFVCYDANIKHAGTTCTDQKRRIVINFNYF